MWRGRRDGRTDADGGNGTTDADGDNGRTDGGNMRDCSNPNIRVQDPDIEAGQNLITAVQNLVSTVQKPSNVTIPLTSTPNTDTVTANLHVNLPTAPPPSPQFPRLEPNTSNSEWEEKGNM